MHGLGFVWYVLEGLNLFSGVCKLEMRFAARASLLDGIELNLGMLELDA